MSQAHAAAARRSWTPERAERHGAAIRQGKRASREARLEPWVRRLETLVCGDGEEFDDAGKAAAAAFLCDLVDSLKWRRVIERPEAPHP